MKTNKMRIMSFILTFIMLINVLGVMPITISATDVTESPLITGVAIIVDGVEHTDSLAIIYSDSEVYIKVFGTNLQNATRDNSVMYKEMYTQPMGDEYSWQIDPSGTFATIEISVQRLNDINEAYTLCYTNDGKTNINSNVSIKYSPNIPEEPFELGENLVSGHNGDYVYVKFIPNSTELYRFYSVSSSDSDPLLRILDENFELIEYSDDGIEDYDFDCLLELTAGKTYYLSLYDRNDNSEYRVIIEKHVHSSVEQNCAGYLCSCGEYYGDGVGDHVDVEGDYDQGDSYCDVCGFLIFYSVVEDKQLQLGLNIVDAFSKYGDVQYIKFIPNENGNYLIYSQSSIDPVLMIFQGANNRLELIEQTDDSHPLSYYDFLTCVEFKAGVEYYFLFCTYEDDIEKSYEVVIDLHESCDEEIISCKGTYCADCFVEISDEYNSNNHYYSYGECMFCEERISDNYVHDCVYSYEDCRICGNEHNCENEDFGVDGRCTLCNDMANYSVLTNGIITYSENFTNVLEIAVDGSTITLYEDITLRYHCDIYENIIIDLNGYRLRARGDGVINLYGDVVFKDSSDEKEGTCRGNFNFYGDITILDGIFEDINSLTDTSIKDFIPSCANVYLYDYELDEWVLFDVTDIPFDKVDEFKIEYNKASEKHFWKGNYGEGTKTCDDCGLTVASKIYSGDAARTVSAAITRAAANATYEILLKAASVVANEYLDYIKFGMEYIEYIVDIVR